MKKIYISGMITGLDPDFEVAKKKAAVIFSNKEEELKKRGFDVVNPFPHKPDVIGEPTWQDYLKLDLTLLFTCDCIYMMSNFAESKGAQLELHNAKALGMEIIYEGKLN